MGNCRMHFLFRIVPERGIVPNSHAVQGRMFVHRQQINSRGIGCRLHRCVQYRNAGLRRIRQTILIAAEQFRESHEARLLDYTATECRLCQVPDFSEMCQDRSRVATAERVKVLCIKREANRIWIKLMQREMVVGQVLEVLAVIAFKHFNPETVAESSNSDSRNQVPESGGAEKRKFNSR